MPFYWIVCASQSVVPYLFCRSRNPLRLLLPLSKGVLARADIMRIARPSTICPSYRDGAVCMYFVLPYGFCTRRLVAEKRQNDWRDLCRSGQKDPLDRVSFPSTTAKSKDNSTKRLERFETPESGSRHAATVINSPGKTHMQRCLCEEAIKKTVCVQM